jgi:calcineurin-like phosphoesterase family protein
MAVYTGDSVDNLMLVGSNDDVSATDRSSSVTFIARGGTEYWIAVDGYRWANGPAASGDYTFQWELLGPDPALAPNDDFASAWQLTGQSGSVTASNVLSTKQAGEPNHAGNPGGASVWFTWTAPVTAYVSFDTPGSSFDTLLAAYTGTDVANLHQIAADDDIQNNLWWPDGHYRESYLSFVAQQGQTYYVAVDGKTAAGGAPARGSIFMEWWQTPPNPSGTLLAAGDVHADCTGTSDDATAQLLNGFPNATVAADGDLADPGSTDAAFANCYDPSWGPAKARTRPAVGNHEYDYSPNAQPYFNYFGAQAGAPNLGWYSYDMGGWHIVVLNSNCDQIGGCDASSPEYAWLQQDLQANVNPCTLAYWHHPLFASSTLSEPRVKPFWDLLYQYGADIVINAHARQYERFAPMAPNGSLDSHGIREFVVGTGGAAPLGSSPTAANSELVNFSVYGLLKLGLQAGGYTWQFLPTAGSFADSGHGDCNGGSVADPQFVSAPPAPTVSKTVTSSGQYTVSWGASPDIPTGGVYSLYRRSAASATYSLVAGALTGTSYTFGTGNPDKEGTWVYRVQAAGAGKTSAYSADSPKVVVDKSAPLPPLEKPDRPAEYPAGNWWKDQVTISTVSNGDAVLADGTPGSGVNPSSLKAPVQFKSNGTFSTSGQATDMVGWKSLTASITVKVDTGFPALTLACSDVYYCTTRYAQFSAKDDQSGLATPPSGYVLEDSSWKGTHTMSVSARDNVGHVTTKTCSYSVR